MTDTIRRHCYINEGGPLDQFGHALDQSYVIVLASGKIAGMRSEHGYGMGKAVAVSTLHEIVFFDSEEAAQRFAPEGSTVEKVSCAMTSAPVGQSVVA